ncbi:hypothetical protein E4U30_001578 [Claviceps sp. LM220 group G6]|nr:hypothetical protein E4U30_001578 [Claviceps sp. LM220 group G6]
MAPSQCFGFSNLTLHGYTSDRKDSNYKSQAPSLAKVIHSDNTKIVFEISDPAGKKAAEMSRELEDMKAKLEAALAEKEVEKRGRKAEKRGRKAEKRGRKAAERGQKVEKRGRKAAERGREEAERKKKEVETQMAHKNNPLTTGEYLKECHMTEKNFNKTTKLKEATTGPVADATERRYPHFLRPWMGFPEKQKEILDKLPSDHRFTSHPRTTNRCFLEGLGDSLNPIASEIGLGSRQDKVVIEPLRVLLEEIRLHPQLQESLGIHGRVKIDTQMNGVKTLTTRSLTTNKSLGKNGRSDLFCSIEVASPEPNIEVASETPPKTIFKLVWMGEMKTPHKVPENAFQTAFPDGHEVDLREGIVGDNAVRNTVVEIIIQLFSAMVDKGVRYGYTDTGEETVYVLIDLDDPSIVYYHLSRPSSDVGDDKGKMHLSAISQRLAFTVQAIQAPVPSDAQEWLLKTEKLSKWEYERENENDLSSVDSPKEIRDLSARRPRVVEYERDPFNTRSTTRNRAAAEVENEEEASDSVSDKKKTQNLGMHHRPDSKRTQDDFVNRSYCTHECVRGLAFGTPLDKNCPNVKDHGSKHVNRQEFLRLMREQLDGDQAHDHCKPINASGHIGCLFKIRLLPHGYTLVAKAVGLCRGAPLIHEEKMYNHLRDLQGRFIPACPGRITLKGLFSGEAYAWNAFRHFLFLSYAGQPVLKALSKVDKSAVRQVLDALAQLHQRRVMHRDAAPRNMLYDARTGRYMVIDLEMSEPIDGGVPGAVDVHIQKGKRKWEYDGESEPFATESQSLLASLSSSIRAR